MKQPSPGEKSHLRRILGSNRDQLALGDRESASLKISERVVNLLSELGLDSFDSVVGSYQPIKSEVSLLSLESSKLQTRFAYPKVESENLSFYESKEFAKGAFSIREPVSSEKPVDEILNALLVPGVGFDRRGGRLGYGKGYYDRWLESRSLIKIGVAFSQQLSAQSVLKEQHDVAMDFLVTENFILGTAASPQILERVM